MPDESKVCHALTGGGALCGQPGLPKDWPMNHYWVREEDAEHVNCRKCLDVLKEKRR